MNATLEKFKKTQKHIWILLTIILIGIFLRSYNFHDWLRFNADQSRDAQVVSDALKGKSPLPLLGPKAGGTDFRLGNIFYVFQYTSAKIFGDYPDKMAYPDLLFSILSIPLFFLFFRKMFGEKISLSLTALYSLSFFVIKYSRFAWNPNSTPFWTMLFLYALSEVIEKEGRKKIIWSIIAGLALGVSIQLHTFLLIAFPILSILSLFYFSLIIKKSGLWKNALVVLSLALLLNLPQITSEVKNKGQNTGYFLSAITLKNGNSKNKSLLGNIKKDIICQINGNVNILSSLGSAEKCQLYNSKDSTLYKINLSFFGIILFLGGFFLVFYYLRKKDFSGDKILLKITLSYIIILFLLFIPLINEITIRYFLIIIFAPFVFLGFWIEFLLEKIKFKRKWIIIALIILTFISFNLFSLSKNFSEYSDYSKKTALNFENTTLREVELMGSFISNNAEEKKAVFMDGKNLYLFKFQKSIEYFTKKSGIAVKPSKNALAGDIVFQLVPTKNIKSSVEKKTGSYDIINHESFGRFALLKFIKKPR
jgi:hypothetical protein